MSGSMLTNCPQQVLLDAVMSCKPNAVLQTLHEYTSFSSDTLSEALLCYVQKICQRGILETHIKDFDIIYMLLDAGADIDKIDDNKNTCLLYAALEQNGELCEVLLQCGADMWFHTEYGVSVYDYVFENSSSQDLVNIFNKFYPGLWKAVECENIYQVRQLINYWCRTSLKKNGLTLKNVALQTGNEEIINLIFGVYESMELVYHIYAKNTEAVKRKLETCKKNLRLNLRKMSDHGAPILYYLIQSKNVPIIELFVKYDCQIYTIMQDPVGNDMPVLFSALKPDMSYDVVEALLPKNKTYLEDILYKIIYKGMTVLEVAIEKKVSPDIFKLLIDRGGPLLLCDRNQFNKTILDVALYLEDYRYMDVINQSAHEWILNPSQYVGRRLKLALLGWKFEPTQYMENGKLTENVSKFLSDMKLLQASIEEMGLAIESGDVKKFCYVNTSVYDAKLCESNMLWYARVIGNGLPLLHKAVLFDRPEIVKIILDDKPLKESIDNLFDQHHRTALHYAFACSEAKKIQKLLLSYGCSEHVLDKTNREPLDFKDKQDNPAIFEMIKRLKSKSFCDFEPNPWDCIEVSDVPNNSLFHKENYSAASGTCVHEHNFDENANYDFYEVEYEDYSEETTSEDEEENHSRCLIS